MKKVLFVCLGNICRSPSAEGVFRKLVEDAGLRDTIKTDSVGTGNWHIGHPPDSRAIQAAAERGIDISDLRARQLSQTDTVEFDYILAMDNQNLADIEHIADQQHHNKIHLFLDFAQDYEELEVPDPYYGGNQGFDNVLDMIENAAAGLLTTIQKQNAKD